MQEPRKINTVAGTTPKRTAPVKLRRHSGMVREHQTTDAQLRIGESRDSGFDTRPQVYPSSANTVIQVSNSRLGCASPRNDVVATTSCSGRGPCRWAASA